MGTKFFLSLYLFLLVTVSVMANADVGVQSGMRGDLLFQGSPTYIPPPQQPNYCPPHSYNYSYSTPYYYNVQPYYGGGYVYYNYSTPGYYSGYYQDRGYYNHNYNNDRGGYYQHPRYNSPGPHGYPR